jgi:predicted DNA-binding transcriptional regulator AlpA
MDQEPITINLKEATRLSSLGRTLIYQKMSEGSFKSVKVRGRRLIFLKSFKDWLTSLPTEPKNHLR